MEVSQIIPDLAQSQVKSKESILGKDDFLKLLIVQLQNQDPFSTADSLDQISQMANFSSLEAMGNIEKLMEQQMALSQSGFNAQMISLIGKEARSVNDLVKIDETTKPKIAYDATETGPVVVSLVNSTGRVVASETMLANKGLNYYDMSEWDVPSGVYQVEVRPALDKSGSNVLTKYQVYTVGIVKAIDFSGGQTVVDIDGQLVDLSTIVDVRESGYSFPVDNNSGNGGSGGDDDGGTGGDGGDGSDGGDDGGTVLTRSTGLRDAGGVYASGRDRRAGTTRSGMNAMGVVGNILSIPGNILGSILDIGL